MTITSYPPKTYYTINTVKEKDMTELNKKTERLIKRAKKVTEKLEAAKELYREKDKLVDEILELGLESVELEDFTMTVVDCFAGKNKKFKPAAFSRFDLAFAKKEITE